MLIIIPEAVFIKFPIWVSMVESQRRMGMKPLMNEMEVVMISASDNDGSKGREG